MSFGISLHVWGDYACFTRPELKAERMTYEVMTPSAARGILTAIYWKPQFNWVIDRIHVLKPIRTMQIRRNELSNKVVMPSSDIMKGKKEAALCVFIEDKRQQRSATILKDVAYAIDAHVEVVEEETRYYTKGDANTTVDYGYILSNNINSKIIFSIPLIGYPSIIFNEIFS
mgnify:CR=1 FL=1